MGFEYTWGELAVYLSLYAAVGWGVEVLIAALREKQFVSRGFLNLPLRLSSGVTAVLLLNLLPTFGRNIPLQAIMCFAAVSVVHHFADLITANTIGLPQEKLPSSPRAAVRYALTAAEAIAYLLLYLIVHPVVHALVTLIPPALTDAVALVLILLIVLDMLFMRIAIFSAQRSRIEDTTRAIAGRMIRAVWRRLRRAYPGADEPRDLLDGSYTFARGVCFDKLAWVFLLSSFLGALIEMAYCYVTGGGLINRSSVIYGAFSFVWGFGAVVLTVTLNRLTGREDRYVFLAGMLIGGAYEYFCSVFTELVFGTVFWDYSHMPLNIGGRTNVVYCLFWGILAVVWLKMLYPLMSRAIEKIPPLPGKILTWLLILVMACNGLLTAAAMIRYSERQSAPTAEPGVIRRMLDTHYDDEWMRSRWPNMVIPGSGP